MDILPKIITRILFILLIAFTFSPVESFSQSPANVEKAALVDLNSGASEKEYHENLLPLIDFFDSKDVNIRVLLDDPRFELYDGISKRFINAAEYKSKSFESYKTVLGFENKKNLIYDFMLENADALSEAEKRYDIPRHVIAAIIGVESSYGKVVGKYNPFNAYVSMYAENYRADFAQAQLEELLIWTERNDLDVFELKSSYAGAMSYAQFIPYSLNRWFVGDNIEDMDNNIYSVANYLAHFKDITGSIEKAVYRYNPSQMYTDAVLALAKEAEKKLVSAK